MNKFKTGLVLFFLAVLTAGSQTVTDIDGNVYPTVTIGSQVWMKENLKTTRFSNGVAIPSTTSPALVDTSSLFQWAYQNDTSYISIYGRLYTWFAVASNNNLCPADWHVPNENEWIELGDFCGGDTIAGRILKETGIIHWSLTNSAVTNASNFTGLPGGFRGNPSGFNSLGSHGVFWSSSPFGSASFQRGICFNLSAGHNQFLQNVAVANCGMSVRCVRNAGVGIEKIKDEKEIKIFPDPATTSITISLKESGDREFFMYNMSGFLVVQKRISEKTTVIEVSNLVNGLYILKLVDADQIIIKKWIKE